MSAFEHLRVAMAATFNVDLNTITESTKQGDFAAWDSVGHINLIVALEDTFDIEVEVQDVEKLNSVHALLAYLKDRSIV